MIEGDGRATGDDVGLAIVRVALLPDVRVNAAVSGGFIGEDGRGAGQRARVRRGEFSTSVTTVML